MEHLQGLGAPPGTAPLTATDVLSRIHYFRVHSYVEQLAVLHSLEATIESIGSVRVVVIDSVAFHFRRDFEDMVRVVATLSWCSSSPE